MTLANRTLTQLVLLGMVGAIGGVFLAADVGFGIGMAVTLLSLALVVGVRITAQVRVSRARRSSRTDTTDHTRSL